MPDRRTPSHGHMNGPRPQDDDALVVEEQLSNSAILGRVCSEGRVLLQIGSIERCHTTLDMFSTS
jgi:hypothetical protein